MRGFLFFLEKNELSLEASKEANGPLWALWFTVKKNLEIGRFVLKKSKTWKLLGLFWKKFIRFPKSVGHWMVCFEKNKIWKSWDFKNLREAVELPLKANKEPSSRRWRLWVDLKNKNLQIIRFTSILSYFWNNFWDTFLDIFGTLFEELFGALFWSTFWYIFWYIFWHFLTFSGYFRLIFWDIGWDIFLDIH